MEGQVVAMVAQLSPATNLALHRAILYFGYKGAANQ